MSSKNLFSNILVSEPKALETKTGLTDSSSQSSWKLNVTVPSQVISPEEKKQPLPRFKVKMTKELNTKFMRAPPKSSRAEVRFEKLTFKK